MNFSFLKDLDLGESEALALALELKADLILLDESAGRSRAKQLGLVAIGVLGILVEARRSGRIDSVPPLLERLRNGDRFFLATEVRAQVLRMAGEAP